MKFKNREQLVSSIFIITSTSIGLAIYYLSSHSGSWFSTIFIGVLGGWTITAPIVRIKFGRVPFLIIFAAIPVLILPIMLLLKILPSQSPLFIFVTLVHFLFSFAYAGWLHGLRFFALFKRYTWLTIFSNFNTEGDKDVSLTNNEDEKEEL